MSDFSDLLDHAIARSNLSMLELQEASGIPISYLYKLRKGVRFTKKYTPNVLSLIYALPHIHGDGPLIVSFFHQINGYVSMVCTHICQTMAGRSQIGHCQ